jgi:hypothetical protein
MRVGAAGVLMMAAAMFSREGRQWGDHEGNDDKEEVVDEDDNCETLMVSGGGGKQKGRFGSPQGGWRQATPTPPMQQQGAG